MAQNPPLNEHQGCGVLLRTHRKERSLNTGTEGGGGLESGLTEIKKKEEGTEKVLALLKVCLCVCVGGGVQQDFPYM